MSAETRAAIVAEARSWLRTPYHHMGRVKGVGVDCAQLPAMVYAACGLIDLPPLNYYPNDWHMHRSAELYLAAVTDRAVEIATAPLPGDFVLWRFGRCFSHGAIILDWPLVAHAWIGEGVVLEDADASTRLSQIGEAGPEKGRPRPRKLFTLKEWA